MWGQGFASVAGAPGGRRQGEALRPSLGSSPLGTPPLRSPRQTGGCRWRNGRACTRQSRRPEGRGPSGRSRFLGEWGAGARFGRLRSGRASVGGSSTAVAWLQPAGDPSPPASGTDWRASVDGGRWPRGVFRKPQWQYGLTQRRQPSSGCAGLLTRCRRRRPGRSSPALAGGCLLRFPPLRCSG